MILNIVNHDKQDCVCEEVSLRAHNGQSDP